MELSFAALAGNLLAPTILFFVLGLIVAFANIDLSSPEGASYVLFFTDGQYVPCGFQ